MDRKLVEKIEATHDTVRDIVARMDARDKVREAEKRICNITHQQVDARITGLARVVRGKDGDTGLVKAHADLKEAFKELTTKIYVWSIVIGSVSGFLSALVLAIVAAHFSK